MEGWGSGWAFNIQSRKDHPIQTILVFHVLFHPLFHPESPDSGQVLHLIFYWFHPSHSTTAITSPFVEHHLWARPSAGPLLLPPLCVPTATPGGRTSVVLPFEQGSSEKLSNLAVMVAWVAPTLSGSSPTFFTGLPCTPHSPTAEP